MRTYLRWQSSVINDTVSAAITSDHYLRADVMIKCRYANWITAFKSRLSTLHQSHWYSLTNRKLGQRKIHDFTLILSFRRGKTRPPRLETMQRTWTKKKASFFSWNGEREKKKKAAKTTSRLVKSIDENAICIERKEASARLYSASTAASDMARVKWLAAKQETEFKRWLGIQEASLTTHRSSTKAPSLPSWNASITFMPSIDFSCNPERCNSIDRHHVWIGRSIAKTYGARPTSKECLQCMRDTYRKKRLSCDLRMWFI